MIKLPHRQKLGQGAESNPLVSFLPRARVLSTTSVAYYILDENVLIRMRMLLEMVNRFGFLSIVSNFSHLWKKTFFFQVCTIDPEEMVWLHHPLLHWHQLHHSSHGAAFHTACKHWKNLPRRLRLRVHGHFHTGNDVEGQKPSLSSQDSQPDILSLLKLNRRNIAR